MPRHPLQASALALLFLAGCSPGGQDLPGTQESHAGAQDPRAKGSALQAAGARRPSATPGAPMPTSEEEAAARAATPVIVGPPPAYALAQPPSPDEARQAIWDAIQARHQAAEGTGNAGAGPALSDEDAKALMAQTTADSCFPTAADLAVCRVNVGGRSHWLRFRQASGKAWAVDGLSTAPNNMNAGP